MERTEAQSYAAGAFGRAAHCYHRGARRREYLVEMRNAWAAYHAGAPWMGHPVSVGSLILQTTRENARLRAEVKRLQRELDARDDDGRDGYLDDIGLDALAREDGGSDA